MLNISVSLGQVSNYILLLKLAFVEQVADEIAVPIFDW